MTPTGDSKPERPLDASQWWKSSGMNPNRRRPLGRQAALLIEYRAYLERQVGKENVSTWFEKYGKKTEAASVPTEKSH